MSVGRRVTVGAAAIGMLVLAACGGGGGSGGSSATKAFHSATYGYTLKYPAAWSSAPAAHMLDDGQPPAAGRGGADVFGVNASTTASDLTPPSVLVGGQKVAPSMTLDAWASNVASTVSFVKACPQPDAREAVTVGGAPGALLRYDDCPKGSGLFQFWVAVVHRGVGYHIVWFDQQKQEATDRPAFEKVLKSLTFNG